MLYEPSDFGDAGEDNDITGNSLRADKLQKADGGI